MASNSGHKIKYRATPQDKFYTPPELAASLVAKVPVEEDDTLFDPFKGSGAFLNAFPWKGGWCEIEDGKDFFNHWWKKDWLISNPPYSIIDEVLEHSAKLADKGFAYLLLGHAITPKRIEAMEKLGFGLTSIHLCKVFKWYGISAFCIWEKGKPGILNYDRKVWR